LSKPEYNIISTGSKGNAVLLYNSLLIDCGVPYKLISPFLRHLRLVLLTHIHQDHFKASTIRRMAQERPTLRFACGRWLVQHLVDAGVSKDNIDVLESWNVYNYGLFLVAPVPLVHDVPNYGYKIHLQDSKIFYATDTYSLDGITAPDYDLYMVEANFEDEAIRARIREKKEQGAYAYERRVLENHLSKAKCDDFIYSNIGPGSEYVYLHCHEGESLGEEI
jgi:phosphoribosyl 1,2-cyclic phosphodiesterase